MGKSNKQRGGGGGNNKNKNRTKPAEVAAEAAPAVLTAGGAAQLQNKEPVFPLQHDAVTGGGASSMDELEETDPEKSGTEDDEGDEYAKKKQREGEGRDSTGDDAHRSSGGGGPPNFAELPSSGEQGPKSSEIFWLFVCFLGIMVSFVCYGLLLEYTTSGGRQLHELSFLFVTSSVYTLTAAAGRYVRAEKPTTIPPARFALLGLTSMGSTFCSVRSLRYVIYPIQVLAKSCKPVPVMLMGALMGKKYPPRKYVNVVLIVLGVGLFMGAGDGAGKKHASVADGENSSASQFFGILLLFVSLCFDGGTGAYEDKLMSVHSVGPFDLMYNIQLGKTILAGVALLVLNQVHVFLQMCSDMGFLLVALGISGALGQVFIFVTISKFGALTCSIIGLARKVTTLIASIYFYGHTLNGTQVFGLSVSVGAMVANFWGRGGGKKKGGGGGHGNGPLLQSDSSIEMKPYKDNQDGNEEDGNGEDEDDDDEERQAMLKGGGEGGIELEGRGEEVRV